MAELQIEVIPVLSDNYSYLVHEPDSGITAIVDPPVAQPFQERLAEKGWNLDWISCWGGATAARATGGWRRTYDTSNHTCSPFCGVLVWMPPTTRPNERCGWW